MCLTARSAFLGLVYGPDKSKFEGVDAEQFPFGQWEPFNVNTKELFQSLGLPAHK